MEIWKDIVGYEGLYIINENAEIKSLPKRTIKGTRLMKPNFRKHYYMIDLVKDKIVKKHLVHRLVAITFHPNPENKTQVNHIDGNKINNKASNLEWATHAENQKHSIATGLRSAKGIKNSQCKVTEEVVLKIWNDPRLFSQIHKDFSLVSLSTIYNIKNGDSWTHLTGAVSKKNTGNRSQWP